MTHFTRGHVVSLLIQIKWHLRAPLWSRSNHEPQQSGLTFQLNTRQENYCCDASIGQLERFHWNWKQSYSPVRYAGPRTVPASQNALSTMNLCRSSHFPGVWNSLSLLTPIPRRMDDLRVEGQPESEVQQMDNWSNNTFCITANQLVKTIYQRRNAYYGNYVKLHTFCPCRKGSWMCRQHHEYHTGVITWLPLWRKAHLRRVFRHKETTSLGQNGT